MGLDKLTSHVSRLFFAVAFLLAAVAIFERIANFVGFTLLRGMYNPGRLLELAALLLIFVVAVLLRQIRDFLGEDSSMLHGR